MNTKYLKLEIDSNIAICTINRPDSYNALNSDVLRELKDLLSEVSKNSQVKGLILTGEGEKAFIAGADIKEMAPMNKEEGLSFSELGQKVSKKIENLPFPTIAAVNGFALGGGLEMALSCDFIFCTMNAVMGLPEVSLGLIPGFGGTQRLSRLIGKSSAKELIFAAKKIKADEALKLGLVTRVFETKLQMIDQSKELLQSFFANSKTAIALAKNAIQKGIETELDAALSLESNNFAMMFQEEQMIEGTKAFIEKRKPNFK